MLIVRFIYCSNMSCSCKKKFNNLLILPVISHFIDYSSWTGVIRFAGDLFVRPKEHGDNTMMGSTSYKCNIFEK